MLSYAEEERITKKAAEMGIALTFTAGGIFAKSPRGHWRIEQGKRNKWFLNHENFQMLGRGKSGYHKHTSPYPTLENALQYIRAHDNGRYTFC